MRTRRALGSAILAWFLFTCGCTATHRVQPDGSAGKEPPGVLVTDAGGRPIEVLETGSSLFVGARGLRPNTTYEFRLGVDRDPSASLENAVSFARSVTDSRGAIPPLVLWYESGVVGCSTREEGPADSRFTFRSFDDAEHALAGKKLLISVHPVQADPTGHIPPQKLGTGKAESIVRIPVAKRLNPLVYASDADGCLRNSGESGDGDLYVSGRNFSPGEVVEVSVAPNQRSWSVGDPINDITGVRSAAASERVTVDAAGRFNVDVWGRSNQRHGAYDIIVQRPGSVAVGRVVSERDIISYLGETAHVLYLRYPVGGPTMDIAGRSFSGSPYFEFADSFADTNDPVWGAVDPTYVPTGHPGGSYAAYYVVAHKDVAGWAGSNTLVDVSNGIEIYPVKAGCINGTDTIIWDQPLVTGQYDVVVDFGVTAATSPATYSTDSQYNEATDFLDGADQIGFVVAPDPHAFGSFPIGQDRYSVDDFFPVLGSRPHVDLRAVVRYPATAAGVGMPVAPGAHPVFVIEHGNHATCNVAGFDGVLSYDLDHTGCPSRKENHLGYMGLLDRLASHGIIAVSIDAYDLTGWVPQLMAERSDLILKHLELWSHMNDTTTFTAYPDFFSSRFAGHVDMGKISVSGHSRGGEASVGAYVRNLSSGNPFTIASVSSIAPVDGQFYVLPDVPYFVILPAADGDVCPLSGMGIYDRAGSGTSPPDRTTKSGIDVYGASHNFFNTIWAADEDDGAPGRDDFIPAADQQRLGEAYLAAFARAQLNNETVYEDMLRGRLSFPSVAGRKVYPFRHEKEHSKIESGSGSLAVASGGATAVSVSPSVHETDALQVAWNAILGQVTYTVPLAQRDASAFEVLSFRVAQTNSATNPVSGDQDFGIELFGGGKSKIVLASRFGKIPRPYNHVAWCTPPNQNVMTTIRVPLHSFIMSNSGVTLDDIDTIRITFLNPSQGEIYVDDIEFSR